MPVRMTSIDSYKSIVDELGPRQKLVYAALTVSPKTNQELSDFLGLPINQITPRTNELCEAGIVKYGGVKVSEKTHKRQIVWAVVNKELDSQLRFA